MTCIKKSGGTSLNNRLYQFLGLAKRAHFAIVGVELMDKLSRNKVSLVILALDASANFIADIEHNSGSRCDIIRYKSKAELGFLLDRREINAIGITDKNMAKTIMEIIQKGEADE